MGKTTDFQKIPAQKESAHPVPVITNSGKTEATAKKTSSTLSVLPKDTGIETCPFRSLINEWLDACRADGRSAKTIQDYQEKVFKFWWWWSEHSHYALTLGAHPKNVTTKEARAFAAYLREPLAFRWGERVPRERLELSAASIASYGRTVKVFFNWLKQHPNSFLWLTEDGEPLSYDGFGSVIRRIEKKSGVDFDAHKLRHTFATMMAGQGVNVFDLKEMLGHASITTTQIYVQQDVARLAEVHRTRSPLSTLAKDGNSGGLLPGLKRRRGRPRKERQ